MAQTSTQKRRVRLLSAISRLKRRKKMPALAGRLQEESISKVQRAKMARMYPHLYAAPNEDLVEAWRD